MCASSALIKTHYIIMYKFIAMLQRQMGEHSEVRDLVKCFYDIGDSRAYLETSLLTAGRFDNVPL